MKSVRPGTVHAPLWPGCVKNKDDDAKFKLHKKIKN